MSLEFLLLISIPIRLRTVDAPIAVSTTFDTTSIVGFRITAGYVFQYTFSNGMNSDTVTFNFGSAAVPEPKSAVMLGVFLLAMVGYVVIRARRMKLAADQKS